MNSSSLDVVVQKRLVDDVVQEEDMPSLDVAVQEDIASQNMIIGCTGGGYTIFLYIVKTLSLSSGIMFPT